MLMRRSLLRWLLVVSGTVLPGVAQGQVLSLADALRRAGREGFASRGAAAAADLRAGQAAAALRTFLPALRVETGYLRTTDPLGAFGAILRERAVTPSAFAPDRLNHPDPTSQWAASLIMEQPLVNLDGWWGRKAASRGSEAADAARRWAQSGNQLDVVRAYYGTIFAGEQVGTLAVAVEAALAHQRQAESLHRSGLVTGSDELLASVRAGDLQVQLAAARGSARLARQRLALALGSPSDTAFSLPAQLPDTAIMRTLALQPDPAGEQLRGDVEATRLELEAATLDHRRATSLFIPRLNAFGRLDWNSSDMPFGNQNSWTVGVMLSWSPFTGGSELAERRIAAARRDAATVQAEAAQGQARLESLEAGIALDVALERLTIAGRSVAQSAEAHRIVTRKYEGGLATVVELLDAAAVETSARLGYTDARFGVIQALAERRRAGGVDLLTLADLDLGE